MSQKLVDGALVDLTAREKNELAAIRAKADAEAGERLKAAIVASAEERLNEFARSRGYDGILSACTYANDTDNPTFAVEGQRCVDLRGQTWAKLHSMLAEVEAGARPIPSSFADIEHELPKLTWDAA